jgi:PadR family transcriptional regulator, regulatory protein PadR
MIRVLQALATDSTRWRYGYELGNEVNLKSGSLYPILVRLADRGLLEASWEPSVQGKPPRHLYRLTAAGLAVLAAVPMTGAAPPAVRLHRRLREA